MDGGFHIMDRFSQIGGVSRQNDFPLADSEARKTFACFKSQWTKECSSFHWIGACRNRVSWKKMIGNGLNGWMKWKIAVKHFIRLEAKPECRTIYLPFDIFHFGFSDFIRHPMQNLWICRIYTVLFKSNTHISLRFKVLDVRFVLEETISASSFIFALFPAMANAFWTGSAGC